MKKASLTCLGLLLLSCSAFAQTPPTIPDAAASDPKALGIMQGFPPAADKTVRIADGSGWKFPQIRWAFSHTRELGPTVDVWRGGGKPTALPVAERKDLDNVAFTTIERKSVV